MAKTSATQDKRIQVIVPVKTAKGNYSFRKKMVRADQIDQAISDLKKIHQITS